MYATVTFTVWFRSFVPSPSGPPRQADELHHFTSMSKSVGPASMTANALLLPALTTLAPCGSQGFAPNPSGIGPLGQPDSAPWTMAYRAPSRAALLSIWM